MRLKSLELKIPPPAVFLAFAGMIWLLSRTIPWAAFSIPGRGMIAIGITAASGFLAGPAIVSFLRAGTTLHPADPGKSTKLVVSGIYSVTRNPMYLSLLLLLFAEAVYLSNLAAFVPLALFVAYLNRFQIIPEEKILVSLFGSEYEAYRNGVRRWL